MPDSNKDTQAVPENYVRLKGSERRSKPTTKFIGAASGDEMLKVTIALRRRPDGPPVPGFDYFAKTPPSQRQRMPQDEFAAKYGASHEDMSAVVEFARSHNLTVVETHAARRTVVVSGTVAQMSEAFAVTLGRYHRDLRRHEHDFARDRRGRPLTETYRGRDGFIHVPQHLADIIVGVFGLDNRRITGMNGSPGDPLNTNVVTIQQVTQLYNFPTPAATIGDQTIGIFSPSNGYGGYFQSDLELFFGASLPSVTPITVDAANGSIEAVTTVETAVGGSTLIFAPTPGILVGSGVIIGPFSDQVGGLSPSAGVMTVNTTATSTTITLGIFDYTTETWNPTSVSAIVPAGTDVYFNLDNETTQDVCISASAAPGANVGVYFSSGTQAGWVDMIHRAIHPDAGDYPAGVNPPSVISSSFYISGGDDPYALADWGVTTAMINAVHAAFQDAALQGVTVCIACGDYGSNSVVGKYIVSYDESTNTYTYGGDGNAHVQYPASDPWVLSVGGTTLGGNTAGSPPPWVEFVWNDPAAPPPIVEWGTTGGGVSDFFPLPSYQVSASVPNSINLAADPSYPPFNTTGRGVPDVAANASYNSGYSGLYFAGSSNWYYGNGTSASSPLWAGFIALVNSNLGFNVGFVNPILYALGSSVFNPINPLNPSLPQLSGCPTDNSNSTIAGYPAGPGWDACTGWGSPNGQELLTALQLGTQKDCYFILDWTTFAKAGIDEMLAESTPAVFNPAFYVVADWFTPSDLGVGATPVQPVITFSPPVSGITAQLIAGPTPDGTPTVADAPQRFTYTYQLNFNTDHDFPPSTEEFKAITLNASITGAISGYTASSSAVIELTNQSNPFMVAGSVSWLSNDIRVFQIQPGQSLAGDPWNVMGNTGNAVNDATTFIQGVVQGFNNLAASELPPNHPFDAISTSESSALDILATSGTTPVYNFAVARVRYQDPGADAENVRVFFRTFPALAISTAYDQTTTYRRWSDGTEFGQTIPLLGSQYDPTLGMQLETIPFFAQPRVDATTVSMDTQTDPTNIQTIVHNPGNTVVYAYYGCWLDINQPFQLLFPQTPTGDGPFSGTLVSILSLLGNQHQCITAEIAFDPDPIPTGVAPGSSNMLGQRNLTLGTAANPGDAASRNVSNPFELRPTATKLAAGIMPDELMVDWSNIPAGSVATLYLPEASASAIVAGATKLYANHMLAQTDEHTIQFPAAGITYVPIPQGEANLAALISVELPLGIRKRQVFQAIARQLTSVVEERQSQVDLQESGVIGWRRILGTFQLTIPVLVKAEMLAPEERLLSVLRWMLETASKKSRWFPVFSRYVSQIAARVMALGGNPARVLPSPIGNWQPPKPGAQRREFTGKIAGVSFDRFGDFDGFLLETKDGHEHSFSGREHDVEVIVSRALADRSVLSVFTEEAEPRQPVSIILRRTARPL
jgi:hypothetical protein